MAVKKINCTNAEWTGRAQCEQCHIRHSMLFSDLPTSTFDQCPEPINHYRYLPGSLIYKAGSPPQNIYSIRQGMIKLEFITEEGISRIVRLLGPGSAIGLEILDDDKVYLHNAIAISEVDLCKIPLPTLTHLEASNPMLGNRIRKQLQTQLNLADIWIYRLNSGSAPQRVARLILFLHEVFADKNGDFILLHREDMSAMINIVPETISRIVAQLKRENKLIKTEEHLFTCDVVALEAMTKGR